MRSSILTDTFRRTHHYLRVSLTERCNFRCQYCMPESGVALTPQENLLSVEETKQLLSLFSSLGVTKVRFTGGEPLLQTRIAEMVDFTRRECHITDIGITTNGVLLPRYMDALVESGLTRVNISIDTLQQDKFKYITRRNGLASVLKAIEAAKVYANEKRIQLKLNCVMMRGFNTDEVADFALLAKESPIEVRFIEYMPFSENSWEKEKVFTFMECLDTIEQTLNTKLHFTAGEKDGVAKLFRADGFQGKVGFISTMTTPFCGSCSRLRLTADGKLLNCLFDQEEVNLLEVLRHSTAAERDANLTAAIARSVRNKKKSLRGRMNPDTPLDTLWRDGDQTKGRPMVRIGG
ncbi:molybdenum cofactor biosynthesis protein [Angomonas deanei]|uniref:GTP 3',8-cyclase n=1 Tax=Angomonas deanei TaxID=59799 RepID=S9TAF8_9TRYP|nr:molybdenum cofactor biosynthesis protein [Angomonas deanei]EPY23813.1 molybdenum cofactor biosynthesis protein [Angomonas deanei]CAD2214832.1 Radical SAM superfamily/4Fe-4S single cluster domain/Molybdenum Cofactor Synthesis C, putative [Angomonas deanei]|eukprot:EPY14987.1 molybdenum cofactor biosynthesis protein [Angomonas deanei]